MKSILTFVGVFTLVTVASVVIAIYVALFAIALWSWLGAGFVGYWTVGNPGAG